MSNGSVYKTDYGYEPTAWSASSSFSPSALDLEGIVTTAGINRDTLASGVFDNARVFIFKCNFLAPIEDYEELGQGFFGKSERIDHRFRIAGLGLVDAISQTVGGIYSSSCQRIYGSAACGISLAAVTVTGTLTAVTSNRIFRDAARGEAADWFGAGEIHFTSGQNVGLRPLAIKAYAADGSIATYDPCYYPPAVGDAYTMVKGCRRRESDCVAQGNIINFFGFTRIPTGSTYATIGGQ